MQPSNSAAIAAARVRRYDQRRVSLLKSPGIVWARRQGYLTPVEYAGWFWGFVIALALLAGFVFPFFGFIPAVLLLMLAVYERRMYLTRIFELHDRWMDAGQPEVTDTQRRA